MILLKLSARPWRLAPWSQLWASLAVGFLLLSSGLLYWLEQGLEPVIDQLKHEQVVTAFLSSDADSKQVSDSIRVSLGAHAEDAAIETVETSGLMNDLQEHYPELARELTDLGPEASSVLPRFVSVAGFLPERASDSIRKIPGVESAESSKDRYAKIVGAFQALQWVGRILALGLALATLVGLVHLGRMNAFFHSEAVSILRLWGAGGIALRVPAIFSGALVGGLGGVLAASAWISGASGLALHVRALSPFLKSLPAASPEWAAAFVVAGLLAGGFSGWVAGSSAPIARGSR